MTYYRDSNHIHIDSTEDEAKNTQKQPTELARSTIDYANLSTWRSVEINLLQVERGHLLKQITRLQ